MLCTVSKHLPAEGLPGACPGINSCWLVKPASAVLLTVSPCSAACCVFGVHHSWVGHIFVLDNISVIYNAHHLLAR